MDKPYFSVTASAIRSDYYKLFYDSVCCDEVPFEIIFVGNNPPKEEMPDNFIYIETDVKPSQCLEIAARRCRGEYILLSQDDMNFSPNFLVNSFYSLKKLDDKAILSYDYKIECYRKNGYCLDGRVLDSPYVSPLCFFKKELWHSLGGIDRRFNGSFADLDMMVRFYEVGMHLFFSPLGWVEERNLPLPGNKQRLLKRDGGNSGGPARVLLNSLWFIHENKVWSTSKTRLSPVQPFDDKDILTVEQN